jgi:hypothetical protein
VPIKAQYIPAKEPMLVLVEAWGSAGPIGNDAARLNFALVKELKDNKIGPLVDPIALEKLRDANTTNFSRMTTTEIGRKLGAKQVLYVNVARAELDMPSGSQTLRGIVSVSVRIIDTTTGETRWPASPEDGLSLTIETPWVQNSTVTAQNDVHDDMATKMATRIGDLFHDWTPDYDNQTEANQY